MAPQASPQAFCAFFDKVQLRSPSEKLQVEQLLDEAVVKYFQAKGDGLSEDFKGALRSISANVAAHISNFVTYSEGDGGGGALQTPSAALQSPLLNPLSPPPVDDEVLQLEAQVEAASKRLEAMRATMQAQLADQLTAKLAQCRPSAAADPPQADAAPAAKDKDTPPLSPRAEDMQARLAEAATKLPTLRARLEDADERLQRVLAAVTSELNRPPPNTIERLVMGRKTPLPAEPGSSLNEALRAGQISTRRGRDTIKPLPYEEEEEAGMAEAAGDGGGGADARDAEQAGR